MFLCPHCKREVRYIAQAPSTGKAGEPIAVDINPEFLITESGRRVRGFREHNCSEIQVEGAQSGKNPDKSTAGDLKDQYPKDNNTSNPGNNGNGL